MEEKVYTEEQVRDLIYYFSCDDTTIEFYINHQELITTHQLRTLADNWWEDNK